MGGPCLSPLSPPSSCVFSFHSATTWPQSSLAHGFPVTAGRAHSRLTSPTRRPIPKLPRRPSRPPQHHHDATVFPPGFTAQPRPAELLSLSSLRSPPTAGMSMSGPHDPSTSLVVEPPEMLKE